MRWTYAGLFLLLIATMTSAAAGQSATGDVEAIGYNGTFRPDAWVPMVVRVKAAAADAAPYQVRVYQHDIDGDRAVYTRTITVNGTTTTADPQRFWMYFLPDPLHHGLPDQYSGTAKDLARDLTVFLCDAKGKQLAQLPLPPSYRLQNVDPIRDSGGGVPPRGSRLVLAVSGNGAKQMQGANSFPQLIGVTQDLEVVSLRIRDLPESPLGYDPVDAVVWLDGDPAELDAGGAHGLATLQDYVRFGGQLVVTQPTTNWQQTAAFADLLPVTVAGVGIKSDFEPLRQMAVAPDHTKDGLGDCTSVEPGQPGWEAVRPPFQMARATLRPGSTVEQEHWIDWGDGSPRTPYLARRAVGLGQVTWVAQPLTTEAQPRNPEGWPYIWLSVLGWQSDAFVAPPTSNSSPDSSEVSTRKERYKPGSPVDLGRPLVEGLNLGSKGAWLIVLAIGFFIVYWLVAGPGTYGYLLAKRKPGLSWFFFAVAALVATGVTVGVVRLVLRGPPEVRHLTVVRIAPGQPAVAFTRFGLYIPRDGDQQVTLADTAQGQLSYVSPMAEHPQVLGDASEFPSPLDYDVPIRDATATDPPLLTVPYRSSLKKFQARWVGDLSPKIGASSLALDLDPHDRRLPLKGALSNDTGQDLTDVYLAFHVQGDADWVVYKPDWPKGTAFDLQRDLNPRPRAGHPGVAQAGRGQDQHEPGDGVVVSDQLVTTSARTSSSAPCWANCWYAPLRSGGLVGGGESVERDSVTLRNAFPMLSLFGRLPPMPNLAPQSTSGYGNPSYDATRAELLARAGRMLDLGPAMQAGQLVVLAQAKGPLPIPVQVEGSAVTGEGTTLYQFLLPIDRSAADKPPPPASRPTSQPTTVPAGK